MVTVTHSDGIGKAQHGGPSLTVTTPRLLTTRPATTPGAPTTRKALTCGNGIANRSAIRALTLRKRDREPVSHPRVDAAAIANSYSPYLAPGGDRE